MPAVLADPEPIVLDRPENTGTPGGGGPRDIDPSGKGGGGGDDDDHDAVPDGSQQATGAGVLAIKLIFVSISALFLTIAVVYFARSRSGVQWNPVGVPSFLWLSTVLILVSSATLAFAQRAYSRFRIESYARWLLATFFLGLTFLISQLLALRQLVAQRIYIRYNPHSSLYYMITGAHAVHLLGGIAALFYLMVRAALSARNVHEELGHQRTLVRVSTLYWHFLGVLWLVLFTFLLVWN